MMDRTILFDVLPVSHPAYLLLRKIFSTKAERRPSLAAIRLEVLAMDTFFLTEEEGAESGWTERLEKMMMKKKRLGGGACTEASRWSSGSSETSSESSESCYSCGSSSSAFESNSSEWSQVPLTPPAPAVGARNIVDKEPSQLELLPRIVAAQTC
jgi:hypothetical protein